MIEPLVEGVDPPADKLKCEYVNLEQLKKLSLHEQWAMLEYWYMSEGWRYEEKGKQNDILDYMRKLNDE